MTDEEINELDREYHREIRAEGWTKLAFPIGFETADQNGEWSLVRVTEYLGFEKWKAFDEDGNVVIVDASKLRNPHM